MKIRGVVTFAIVLLAAAVCLAMTTGTAQDQQAANQGRPAPPDGRPPGPPPGMMGRGGPGGIVRELFRLNLTTEQREQVKSLMDSERQAGESYMTTMHDIDSQVRAAVESGSLDEEAVRALLQKEAAAMVELRLIGAKTEAAIYKLLTAEQKAALAEAIDQAPPRGRRHH